MERFALGGDGMRSPSGMYVIRAVQAVGDGSDAGDDLSVQMALDPNYCSMIGYVSATISQATPADAVMRFQHVGPRVATMRVQRLNVSSWGLPPPIADTWLPPATMIPGEEPGTTSVFVENVGTGILLFNANIFLYDIRAREETPYDLLVAARGGI